MAKIPAQGSTFEFTDSEVTPAFQVVGELISFGIAGGEASEEDVTTLASTSKEYRLGLRDNGELTLDLFHDLDDVGQAAMLVAQGSGAEKPCRLTLSNGKVGTFNGLVKSFPLSGGADESLKTTVVIKVSGDITWV